MKESTTDKAHHVIVDSQNGVHSCRLKLDEIRVYLQMLLTY